MADKSRRLVPSNVSVSANEGAITIVSEDTIQIDPNKLASPTLLYDADYAWASQRLGTVSLFFGKEDLGKQRLRTRLEIRFPPAPFVLHFWRNSREFHERLRTYVTRFPGDPARDTVVPDKWDAVRDHSEWVNLDYLAHSGHQACLDFFNLSIRGMAAFVAKQGSSGLEVVPVVRVHTSAPELCRLLDSCETIVDHLRETFPVVEDDPRP